MTCPKNFDQDCRWIQNYERVILKRISFNIREWELNYERRILFDRMLGEEIQWLKKVEERAMKDRRMAQRRITEMNNKRRMKHQQEEVMALMLKGQSHVTVNKPVISIIYIVVHTWPLCAAYILVDGLNPQKSYFQKFTNISAIVQLMSVSFLSLRSSRVHLQNNTFILRKTVEISAIWPIKSTAKSSFRKNCLHYVTLPL